MDMHAHFHLGHAQLLKGLHDAKFNLELVEFSLHLFIPVILELIQIVLDRLLQFISSYFRVSVPH